MKMIIPTLAATIILWALWCFPVAGQSGLVRVRAGHTLEEDFPRESRWHYPQFQLGRILYRNGVLSGKHYFNYDHLLEGILIIQPNKDTLVVVDSPDYKCFIIQQDTFFRVLPDRYVQVLAGTSSVKLGLRETFIMKRRDRRVEDGYGAFVDQVNSVRSLRNQGHGRMIYDQDELFGKAHYYYLIGDDQVLHRASKSTFKLFFRSRKESIKAYVNRTGMDFRSQQDLLRLFEYCAESSPPGGSVKAQ